MQLFLDIHDSIVKNHDKNAFFIDGVFYTYSFFATEISKIRKAINNQTTFEEKNIGLVINDDIETYASIIAIWLEGKAYVPINPGNPADRNLKVIIKSDILTMIDSSDKYLFPEYNIISPKNLISTRTDLVPRKTESSELAYIFFTSGTTGEPKGVSITRANVHGFVEAFNGMGLTIESNDRVLQMFDLTFDLSVMSYLLPLLFGACIYTIPIRVIKYNYIAELLEEHELTVALMVPSVLHYLRKYFDEISAPAMKYCLFCGEALHLDITKEWSRSLPNADIFNVYGPTENTIFCTSYKYNRKAINKEQNGVMSIGKALKGVFTVIVDDNNKKLSRGEKGELCLAGELLTPGYWKNERKNSESFFFTDNEGVSTRFYKTGDLCIEDNEGDILFLGRIDSQVQIQGFRVELTEIEFHAKEILEKINVVAVDITNNIGNTEVVLFVEFELYDSTILLKALRQKLPEYMIPKSIISLKKFPLNVNGKIDRNDLKKSYPKLIENK